MVAIKLTGDWDKAMKAMQQAPTELNAAMTESLRAEAAHLRRAMVRKLRSVKPAQAPIPGRLLLARGLG